LTTLTPREVKRIFSGKDFLAQLANQLIPIKNPVRRGACPGTFHRRGNLRSEMAVPYNRRHASEGVDLAATSLLEMGQQAAPESGCLLEQQWEYYAPDPPTPAPDDDLERFCGDFVCCGVELPDLHALLQHYEESHVKVEEGDEWGWEYGPHGYGKRRMVQVSVEPQDATAENPSAFDTAIFRTVSPAHYQYGMYPPKRARLPISGSSNLVADQNTINMLRAMLPPVFANAPPDNSLQLIHSALSSTLNPPRPAPSKRHRDAGSSDDEDGNSNERPYICQVTGCGKTYKNPNGLKYHTQHGHDRDGKDSVEKPHRCPFPGCLKRYKNPNGLKYHVQHGHPGQTPPGKVASLKSIQGLQQIEAAIKREQAIRAQLAGQTFTPRTL
jgi:hypothetical protein